MNLQSVKQRFNIIGNTEGLNRAIGVALQVAPTDISVLISGESGTGKETMPKIIHQFSTRKHAEYIAVNCGAIPEGTIDSELFGHEKGAFTGATDSRKGYFEVADNGTIFLDEIVELPSETQVRLLRVLETGEYLKVGSSKVQKTNVRIIAASNENMQEAIRKGKFREDLFYRLSTVPISLPPLRDRKEDIHILFRKFASDFAEKYRMPTIRLSEGAINALTNYRWPGNIRQLKNIAEQISVIEENREISTERLLSYLPNDSNTRLPMVIDPNNKASDFSDRDLLYKVLFDMKKDMTEVKQIILSLIEKGDNIDQTDKVNIINRLNEGIDSDKGFESQNTNTTPALPPAKSNYEEPSIAIPIRSDFDDHEDVEETFSLQDQEKDLILKALEKHNFRKKYAAQELGISERTLYRKIRRYGIDSKKKKGLY